MTFSRTIAPRAPQFRIKKFSKGLSLLALSTVCLLAQPFARADAPADEAAVSANLDHPLSGTAKLAGKQYELKLHHLHTGESLDVVYRIGNTYIPSAVAKLNHFLRDHRTDDQSHYDPKEFDLLHNVLARLGKTAGTIDVVCGYRTPWSNNFLRTRSADTGVAEHSQHMLAKAIDIRVPGVTTSRLRDAALSLAAGGVGYYPVSQFVHVDVGPVRQWSFGGGDGAPRMRHRRGVKA